jgi:hypothetical protein
VNQTPKFKAGDIVVGHTRGGWSFSKGRVESSPNVDLASNRYAYPVAVLEGSGHVPAGQVITAYENDLAHFSPVVAALKPQLDGLEGSERRIELRKERAAREAEESEKIATVRDAENRAAREELSKGLGLIQKAPKNCGLTEAQIRKMQPVGTIVRSYFPDALRAVAAVAFVGNEKHNPGEPLHWARGKSDDHDNAMLRHFIDGPDGWNREELKDGRMFELLHAANAAWRALAELQLAVERADGEVIRVLSLPNTAGEACQRVQLPLGGETA